MGDRFYLRNPAAVVISRRDACTVIAAGKVAVLESIDPDGIAELLCDLSVPRSRADLVEAIGDEGVARLVETGALVEGSDAELAARLAALVPPLVDPLPCRHLVVGLTGAIGVQIIAPLLPLLRRRFAARIDIVATEAALHFVTARSFEYLGFDVWVDAHAPHPRGVPHVALAAAEMVLVMPASASTLHRLAHGDTSDLLGLVVAATRAPVVVCPSMNAEMWTHPPIARNVAQLRRDGVFVVEPGIGFRASDREAQTATFGAMGLGDGDLPALLQTILAMARETADRD